MMPDVITKRWMRDASDEYAISKGCMFDEAAGQFAVDWQEEYLTLYEGVWAGRPYKCRDWQYEFTMRLFGWMRPNVSWREDLPGRDWIRRFRAASVFIAKKNKKSPTLAATMIYVAMGESSKESKCFPGAKNGRQVRQNVVKHVHNMISQSPALSEECVINKSDSSVFNTRTNSLIFPLSSENTRTQEALEGLNGSTFIDEVHVVDESFIEVIDRAGISRPEPLHVEMSTVGKDQDTYGFRRFQYCQDVISGVIKDDTLLAMIYAAPQDLKDEDLLSDPIKYAKMANPAWGHTVKEEEFLADLNRSKGSKRKLAKCKMYRFNIWQSSATPWLDMIAWDACNFGGKLSTERRTWGGLDLASKNDFTGYTMIQHDGERWIVKGHYWLSEARAKEHEAQGRDIFGWEEQGWLTVCRGGRGERIDYDIVEAHIAGTLRKYDIQKIGYDPSQCEYMQQRLDQEHDAPMVEKAQGLVLSGPAKSLETLVASHEIDHGGDPVLRWMAANADCRDDDYDRFKVIKPKRMSMKAIDGIVALIMAIGEAEADINAGSIYDEPGAMVW